VHTTGWGTNGSSEVSGLRKERIMNRRQFFALFICSLIPWWVGSGLMPLLPIYAARLGASPAVVGNYLAFIFFSLALGTVTGGWLSAKLHRYRELLLLMGLIGTLATWLMGQVPELWQLILLNAAVWFVAGITLALVAIIAGQNAGQHERGRIFGLLAFSSALGGVLGGPSGLVVDQWGYRMLFTLSATIWLMQIAAAFFLQNGQQVTAPPKMETARTRPAQLASPFLLLLAAALLFSTGGFIGTMGRSLALDAQGFPAATITLIAAIGSGLSLILNPLTGRLSDRVNRRLLLCLIYATGGLSLVLLAYSTTLAAFLIVALLTAASGAERAVSSALVSDLLPSHGLSQGLSLFDGVKWIGGVVGFAGTGYAIQLLGLPLTLLAGAALPLLSIVLLLYLHSRDGYASLVNSKLESGIQTGLSRNDVPESIGG
jgi:MFS family permease